MFQSNTGIKKIIIVLPLVLHETIYCVIKVKIKRNQTLDEGAEDLDLTIRHKIEKVMDLNRRIDELEKHLAKLAQQVPKQQPCKKPTMKDLLVYCSMLDDATSGKLTGKDALK